MYSYANVAKVTLDSSDSASEDDLYVNPPSRPSPSSAAPRAPTSAAAAQTQPAAVNPPFQFQPIPLKPATIHPDRLLSMREAETTTASSTPPIPAVSRSVSGANTSALKPRVLTASAPSPKPTAGSSKPAAPSLPKPSTSLPSKPSAAST